jgi:hypothetical protein
MTVELGLINRVFLTQKIETNLMRNQGFKIQGGRDISGNMIEKDPKEISSKMIENGSAKEKLATVAGSTGTTDEKTQGQFGSAEDESELAVAFDGRILERPVVFGFESVRYSPTPAPIPVDATVAGETK